MKRLFPTKLSANKVILWHETSSIIGHFLLSDYEELIVM